MLGILVLPRDLLSLYLKVFNGNFPPGATGGTPFFFSVAYCIVLLRMCLPRGAKLAFKSTLMSSWRRPWPILLPRLLYEARLPSRPDPDMSVFIFNF